MGDVVANMGVVVERYTDGANEHVGKSDVELAMKKTWTMHYARHFGELNFSPDHDLKRSRSGHSHLDSAASIRNPDMFYWLAGHGPLGGIEVTTHSPDGSNIEKRYPFLWAARRHGLSAFVATPYLKVRPNGGVNRLPNRHSAHNQRLLHDWLPTNPKSDLQQLLPVADLMVHELHHVPQAVKGELWSWATLGRWLAHKAALTLSNGKNQTAMQSLSALKKSLERLAVACIANTGHQSASSLLTTKSLWIQTYNARPETGWWERGEGQLDSIDGRVMFALDTIELLPPAQRPKKFELWLPLMTTRHPWIREQVTRDYGSKRLRNLAVVLPAAGMGVDYELKFGDQMSHSDWQTLTQNPALRLERLVGPPAEYHLSTSVADGDFQNFGRLAAGGFTLANEISNLISRPDIWASTTRPYLVNWQSELLQRVLANKLQGELYLPRVPARTLQSWPSVPGLEIFAAEDCPKTLFFALREFHKKGIIK